MENESFSLRDVETGNVHIAVKLASLRNDQACDAKLIVINVDMIVDLTQLVWYRSRGALEQLPKMTDGVCRSTGTLEVRHCRNNHTLKLLHFKSPPPYFVLFFLFLQTCKDYQYFFFTKKLCLEPTVT